MRYVNLRVMVVFLFVIGAILIVPGCPRGTCIGPPMSCNPMVSLKCGDADPDTGRCIGCLDDGIIYDGAGSYKGCRDDEGYSIDNKYCTPHCKCVEGACGRYRYYFTQGCDKMMPFDCANQGCAYTYENICTTK